MSPSLSCTISAHCLRLFCPLVEFWLETQQQLAVCQNSRFGTSRVNMQNTSWHLAPLLKGELENSFSSLSLRRLELLTGDHWTVLKN